jgi:hypothetical protein
VQFEWLVGVAYERRKARRGRRTTTTRNVGKGLLDKMHV